MKSPLLSSAAYLFAIIAAIALPIVSIAATATSFTDVRALTSATISSGTAASAEIDLGGTELVGIQFPTSFTGTGMTFQVATNSGGTFQSMTDGAGANVSKVIASNRYVPIDPTLFRGVRFLKVISSAAETGNRTITIFSLPAK